MNYHELVKRAGYDTPQGEYLATKLEERQITAKQLNSLAFVFQSVSIAGIDLYEASIKLTEANKEPEIDATESAIELANIRGVDLETITGSGKDGRIVKADILAAVEDKTL